MLLKADDGELHLGNTTLVALDGEVDIELVRAMQYETSGGEGMNPKPWDTSDYGVPVQSHARLMAVGVLGEKDEEGNCLMNVQARFAMNEGAIWQQHVAVEQLGHIAQSHETRLGAVEKNGLLQEAQLRIASLTARLEAAGL